jgi:hypothetical protein
LEPDDTRKATGLEEEKVGKCNRSVTASEIGGARTFLSAAACESQQASDSPPARPKIVAADRNVRAPSAVTYRLRAAEGQVKALTKANPLPCRKRAAQA